MSLSSLFLSPHLLWTPAPCCSAASRMNNFMRGTRVKTNPRIRSAGGEKCRLADYFSQTFATVNG